MNNNYEENPGLVVKSVDKNSIAEECELKKGDIINKINGQPVQDELDLFYFNSFEKLRLEIIKPGNELEIIEIEKSPEESLGIEIEEGIKTCSNHCIFCFIDQMPKGLRDTLYIKDDDTKLSFLKGNYVTLTNLTDAEFRRICSWKTPINISVHTTDPLLRQRMLGNRKAGDILSQLKILKESSVPMNAQIVLVPDYNDRNLIESLEDLTGFFPELASVSVVPVGLTRFREHRARLRTFTKEEAEEIIRKVEKFQEKTLERLGTRFAYLSDEFFLQAGLPVPEEDYYEGFPQLENGVGMVRNFLSELELEEKNVDERTDDKNRLIVTGELFSQILESLINRLRKKYKIRADVVPVKNVFFGDSITVAGLLTGTDILEALSSINLESYDEIILPDTVLKYDTELLLDDMKISELEAILNKKITVLPNDGVIFLKYILGVL